MKKRAPFIVLVLFTLVTMACSCSVGSLSVSAGGCQNGPYEYNKDDPGGHDNGVCRDADGNPAVDDCCCFVASSSGLSHQEISTLRSVRNIMLEYVPGFDKVNDLYHSQIGPSMANYLRTHSSIRNVSHFVLVTLAKTFDLFVD